MSQSNQNPGTLNAVKSAFLYCFSTSTGHGLPQMAKQDNLFLRVLWAVFFMVALVGNSVFIYQAVDQYLQFGVITTTKINRVAEMTFPALTFCSYEEISNARDMIMRCDYGLDEEACKFNNLTIYTKHGSQYECVQVYSGTTNNTKLFKAVGEGQDYGYYLFLYTPPGSSIYFAVTDNSAQLVEEDVRDIVIPGQVNKIALSKTVQAALGQPYSKCNKTEGYRQVNCINDCTFRAMSELCGCEYPAGCGSIGGWTQEFQDSFDEKICLPFSHNATKNVRTSVIRSALHLTG